MTVHKFFRVVVAVLYVIEHIIVLFYLLALGADQTECRRDCNTKIKIVCA